MVVIMDKTNNGWRYDDQREPDDRINLSREQLQHLVEMSPEPIIICCEQRIVYVNPAGVIMIGAEHKAEVVGKNITHFLQSDQVNIDADVHAFLEVDKPSELFERQIMRLDGVIIIVEVRAIPLMYEGKKAIQFLCRNITEQRQVEQSLIDSEQQYRHMIEMSPQAIVIHIDSLITYVNDTAIKLLLAQSGDHIIGESIFKFVHSDYHDKLQYRLKQLKLSNEPLEAASYRIIKFDGTSFEGECTSIVLNNANGESYIQTVFFDMTDRYKEKLLLRESAETYERLIEFLPEPIIVMDNDLVLYMNVCAEKLAKCEYRKQLVGKNVFECIHPQDHDRMRGIFSEVLHNNERSPFIELKMKCCLGEYIDVEMSSTRIHNYMGKTVVISVLRDLTERKHSQEMLVKSEKLSVIGQLAAGVAHEIRNPLTVLKGFTQLLSRELGNKHMYISTMLSELDRINDIVNEFMTLSKPQFVQFHSNYVYNILNSVISILETQAILVNVNIKISYANQIPLIHCDENQLKQVFINIIKNSIEAMPFGGEIDILVELIERNKLLIRICDQGPGIPQEIIRRIGEPFYTTKENGTGLGIMVCQRIIDAHHGTLHISSEPGSGATIDILLPVE